MISSRNFGFLFTETHERTKRLYVHDNDDDVDDVCDTTYNENHKNSKRKSWFLKQSHPFPLLLLLFIGTVLVTLTQQQQQQQQQQRFSTTKIVPMVNAFTKIATNDCVICSKKRKKAYFSPFSKSRHRPQSFILLTHTDTNNKNNNNNNNNYNQNYENKNENDEEQSLLVWKQLVFGKNNNNNNDNDAFQNLLLQIEKNSDQDDDHNNNNVSKKKRKRGGGSRDVLQPRHIPMFSNNDDDTTHPTTLLFQEFAKTICMANTVSKKELLETWSMALIIQHYFFSTNNNDYNNNYYYYNRPKKIRRIADLACGHGLLSWALLVLLLNDNNNNNNNNNNQNNEISAICIDKRMPSKSVDQIQKVMLERWPQLKHRWHYVEHGISAKENIIIPHESTLMCAIHGCGTLTDDIISLANNCNNNNNNNNNQIRAPLVLLPCCHTKKSLPSSSSKYSYYSDKQQFTKDSDNTNTSLSTFVDQFRIQRLQQNGYYVHTNIKIPKSITMQNSIIVAYPDNNNIPTTQHHPPSASVTKMPPPPLNKKKSGNDRNHNFIIPLGPDRESMAIIEKIAGRYAAQLRKMPPPPKFCISLFLPPPFMNVTNYQDRCDENNIQVFLPEEGLMSLANRLIIQNNESKKDHDDTTQIIAHVKALDSKPFAHPNGRFAQTFQITYDNNYHLDDTDSLPYPPISKSDAKQLFQIFCDHIPIEYPGTTLRLPGT